MSSLLVQQHDCLSWGGIDHVRSLTDFPADAERSRELLGDDCHPGRGRGIGPAKPMVHCEAAHARVALATNTAHALVCGAAPHAQCGAEVGREPAASQIESVGVVEIVAAVAVW